MKIIYLDNNATTRTAPEVYEAMVPYFTEDYFNPSSMYDAARHTSRAIAAARKSVADCLGRVDPKEILFTSCATESNNAAILGAAHANPNRRHIITTSVEHPAVLEVCKELERNGYAVTYLGVDREGKLDVREFIRALSPNTLLVSIMHANNETGVIFPIDQLSRVTKQTDSSIIFHTDATQSVGKLPVDLARGLPYVDLLSFSGHKLHAPKGIGVLFIRRGSRCRPFMLGGHQEEGRRDGERSLHYRNSYGLAACFGAP
jgi:cysteine desulfurase